MQYKDIALWSVFNSSLYKRRVWAQVKQNDVLRVDLKSFLNLNASVVFCLYVFPSFFVFFKPLERKGFFNESVFLSSPWTCIHNYVASGKKLQSYSKTVEVGILQKRSILFEKNDSFKESVKTHSFDTCTLFALFDVLFNFIAACMTIWSWYLVIWALCMRSIRVVWTI